MRALCVCVLAALLWSSTPAAGAVESPAAHASAPPDIPVPQPQAKASVTPADDEQCRLATRQSAGVESCLSSTDADHDGVDDGQDECPDTTPGVGVDATGCAGADPND